MSQKVVIVESPAKAKTINKYLGSDYKVLASFGHRMQRIAVDPEDAARSADPEETKVVFQHAVCVVTEQTFPG